MLIVFCIKEVSSFSERVSTKVLRKKKTETKIPQCNFCQENTKARKHKCRGCKAASYCSDQCAQKDWPKHKDYCRDMKQLVVKDSDAKFCGELAHALDKLATQDCFGSTLASREQNLF
jgi:hypothetical protein